MAVLVEGISVIVRRSAIDSEYAGGWPGFLSEVPNPTLCYDDDIVRIGFMEPSEVEAFVRHLERNGLRFLDEDTAIDIVVVDQQTGLTTGCDWLEFGKLNFGKEGKVSACWLYEGPRMGHGLHMRGTSMKLATPVGWEYEGSMSKKFWFIPGDQKKH